MTLKTAVSLSLTGRFAPLGKKARNGFDLWSKYCESRSKTKVEIVIEDDESSPEKAAIITERFCSDKTVDAVFSPYSSSLTLAAAKAALLKGKTLWNHGGASDEINRHTNTVSAITPASRYFIPVIEILKRGTTDTVIANPQDSGFSKAVTDGAEKHAVRSGIKIRTITYRPSTKGFGDVLKELKNTSAFLSVGAMEDEIALAGKILQMREKPHFLCFIAAGVDEFGKIFGDKSEGIHSVSQWEESNKTVADFGPSCSEFAAMFRRQYGHSPDYPAAQAFNIGLILQKCVEKAGTTDDGELRKAAGELDFKTFYGGFKIDKTGKQTGHRMVVTQWRRGKRAVLNTNF